MANDVTTMDPADGLRDQAWRALSLHPSTTTSLAERLGDDAAACIDAAIAKTEHDLRLVPEHGEGRAAWNVAIDERLRRLAVKVLPTAKPADTLEWRSAMTDALSDLPAMVGLTAAKRAIHRPFRFVGEIEAAVREIAADIITEREQRLLAFRRHRDALHRAMIAPPAPPSADPDAPFTDAQIKAMSQDIRQMGLTGGFITQDQIDAALCSEYVPDRQEAA